MNPKRINRVLTPRNVLFALFVAASALVFRAPLRGLMAFALGSTEYSYILLMPVLVVGLFYVERAQTFRHVRYSPVAGSALMLAGVALAWLGADLHATTGATRLALRILGLVVIWLGAFIACYGAEAAVAGRFPLLFVLLFVPLPRIVLDTPIDVIRHSSADVTSALLRLFGVPVFRAAMTFSLPRLTFVVAQECSGIHSIIALFIASLLAGHYYVNSLWKKLALMALVFPIVSFTNGLRMFVISSLSNYVSLDFFYGNLHHKGGSLFFALGLVILGLATILLRGRPSSAKTFQPARRTPLSTPVQN